MYICVWKHVGFLHEDFLSVFLPLLNIFLGVYFASVLKYADLINSFVASPWCEDEKVTKSALILQLLCYVTISWQIYVFVSIYKRKRVLVSKKEAKRELIVTVLIFALILIGMTVAALKINSRERNSVRYKLFVYCADLIVGPSIFTFIIPLIYIVSNKNLKKYCVKMMKRLFRI